MGVTGKGNYKRGQEEQGEHLLGNQKSEVRSGGWAGEREREKEREREREGERGRRNKLHTKPGMKPRCLNAVIPLLPAQGNPPAEVS